MTSNSPRGKCLSFETVEVVIFSPGKKGITVIIYHLGRGPTILRFFVEAELWEASGQAGNFDLWELEERVGERDQR